MNVFEPGQTKYSIEVMQAYVDGKTIQGCNPDVTWGDVEFPTWDWSTFNYRVKPEPLTCWVTVLNGSLASTVHMSEEDANICVHPERNHEWTVRKVVIE